MPGLEGRAFYPLFPTSFAKYFQMLSNIHSARMYAAQALLANELWALVRPSSINPEFIRYLVLI